MNPLPPRAAASSHKAAPTPAYPSESLAANGDAIWEGGESEAALSVPSEADAPGEPLPAPDSLTERLWAALEADAAHESATPAGPIGALGKPDLWPELLARLGDLPARFRAAFEEYRSVAQSVDRYCLTGRNRFIRDAFTRLNHVDSAEQFHAIASEIAACGEHGQRAFFHQAAARFCQVKYRKLFAPLAFELEALAAGVIADLRADAQAREAEAGRVSREQTGADLIGRPLSAKVDRLEATVKHLIERHHGELSSPPRRAPTCHFEPLF